MSSRRRARGFALQVLCAADVRGHDAATTIEDLKADLQDAEEPSKDDAPTVDEAAFASRLVEGVHRERDRIDACVEKCSTNWRVARMPLVDRNILRLATFELMCCEDIPGAVSINEAIELAKLYGGTESRAFVNGTVDRVARTLGRVPKR